MTRWWVCLAVAAVVTAAGGPVRACDPSATATAARERARAEACAVRERANALRDAERAARDAERAVRDAERAAREAAVEAARDESREAIEEETRATIEALRERLRAEMRASAAPQPGMVVTPRAMLFVDGPEVPIEWVEWADGVGSHRVRHATATDTVVKVDPGTTLALVNLSGDISVQVWDRNEVHIQAEHDRDDRIAADLDNGVLKLGVRSRQGEQADVEWTLTVPRWLPLELYGMESEIAVTGMRSSVRARSMRGDVVVRSCQGPLEVNSVEGEVHVSDVSGNVTAGTMNSIIRIVRVTGPVEAQTINGDIQLEKVASASVDASTVNGRVFYASPFQTDGRYAFSSHNGKLYVGLPLDQLLKIKLSSFKGQVESSVPVPMPAPEAHRRLVRFNGGRTYYFTMGRPADGTTPPAAPSAPRAPSGLRASRAPQAPELQLESFGGLIQLASQEEALRAIDVQRAEYDSLRSSIQRARREVARARRMGRLPDVDSAPDPPPPPPPPHH
jgi:hypothetical protein